MKAYSIFIQCFFSLSITLTVCSEENNEPDPTPTPPSNQYQAIDWLKYYSGHYPLTKVVWLSEEKSKYFIVRTANEHKKLYGKLILIPDINEAAISIGIYSALENELSKTGWRLYHLFISPPYLTRKDLVAATTEQDNVTVKDSPAVATESDDVVQKTQLQYIEEVIQFAQEEDSSSLFLIVKGYNSQLVLNQLDKLQSSVSGFIFLWPQLLSFEQKTEQTVINSQKPYFVVHHHNETETINRWLYIERKKQGSQLTELTLPKSSKLIKSNPFIVSRLHHWMKEIANPKENAP